MEIDVDAPQLLDEGESAEALFPCTWTCANGWTRGDWTRDLA
ncbi:MAG: hypothetical protein QOC94_1091 [Actinoplanes sp.]|nr:hypothetical protein [Actinoplanes sp.]